MSFNLSDATNASAFRLDDATDAAAFGFGGAAESEGRVARRIGRHVRCVAEASEAYF